MKHKSIKGKENESFLSVWKVVLQILGNDEASLGSLGECY